ncbi:hypothetical protein VTJ49DRAFT_4595 [Mycothermus thermophilus]|uniref:Zn(2)-C6 fungal-type domain-containing protein n=1 Tax=Humicola insolens TaxID=85995 RepID=A0ABR3V5E1_HUMIN
MDDVDMVADAAPPSAPAPAPTLTPTPTPISTAPPSSAGSPAAPKLSEPRRRNRPALSCIQCRTRKIRCDRNEPCASCIKSKILNCTYEEARRPKPRLWRLSPAPTGVHPPEPSPSSTSERPCSSSTFAFRDPPASASCAPTSSPLCSAPGSSQLARAAEVLAGLNPRCLSQPQFHDTGSGSSSPAGNATALAERVRQLEQQLAEAMKRVELASSSSRSAHAAASPEKVPRHRALGSNPLVKGEKLTKLCPPFPLIDAVAERIRQDTKSDAFLLWQRCREVSRSTISPRTSISAPLRVGDAMPPRDTVLRLVDAYFRTFECVYRILHRPTFWQAFDKFWENLDSDPAFVVQLQLCMAIGTRFRKDAAVLRPSAAQWISEARIWMATSAEKHVASLSGLQTMCLLHLARETCGVGDDLSWVGAGSLLRTAMYLGLHRDSETLPGMSAFEVEMRRRLWATVLEIVLQSSLDSGAPPLVSLDDFDTRPPSNYDDDQLAENAKGAPSPRPPHAFTQTTVQIALLRSFPVRLTIAQYVNHFSSSPTVEETLRWNAELTNACRTLSSTFQPFYDPAGILPKRLSLFQLRMAEHMVHRFFLVLNYPWLWSAQNDSTYYFARKMCVETSLKLYRAIATGSPAGESGTACQSDDFTRLATCGYGAFRSVPTLAVLTICLELLWQSQEEWSFGQRGVFAHSSERDVLEDDADMGRPVGNGAAPRQELIDAVKYSIGWAERRIRHGETNVKAYLLFSALLCQAQAVQRGLSGPDVAQVVMGTVVEDLNHCLLLLRELAGRDYGRMNLDGPSNRRGLGAAPTEWVPEDKVILPAVAEGLTFPEEVAQAGTITWRNSEPEPQLGPIEPATPAS